MASEANEGSVGDGVLTYLINEIFYSPLNFTLLVVILYLLYKMKQSGNVEFKPVKREPRMKKRDMTLDELRQFDGTGEPGTNSHRVLLAVNGNIFDASRGRRFYGPGGPYSAFAGRDASRGLANFSVNDIKDDYDDLSDLNTEQMNSIKEWEMQFREKYDFVGRLIKPGEEPASYSDDDEEGSQQEGRTTESEAAKSKSN